jgi:hypothetical protein
MILEVRILNELRRCFVDVRILQGLVDCTSRAGSERRRGMVGDLMRRTQESLAREYQLAKYYVGNGKNWGVSGRWEL